MDFVSNKQAQIEEMLAAIGVASIEDLFVAIPKALRLAPPSGDDGLSELEGMQLMEGIAAKNTFTHYDHYLGGGAYDHHIPAVIAPLVGRGEFLTAYTPYQPEASQGMLQAIFEFQSSLCALTGLDVANASVYDGASASAEAALMALRHHKQRKKIVVAGSLHPHYFAVIEQYLSQIDAELVTVPVTESGCIDLEKASVLIDSSCAAVVLQYPNFFGLIEEMDRLLAMTREAGALSVLVANPLVYGLYRSAGELGADIAVGDLQPFGLPLAFGGPYVGYMCCRKALVRQLPGRIVGETVDTHGRGGFVLTLQAREQHIRREKATSNICTNQSLAALSALIALSWYGKKGLPALALTNYQRASYLRQELAKIEGMKRLGEGEILNEFSVRFPVSESEVLEHFREQMIEPGIPLSRYGSQFEGYFLIAVTEKKSKQQLDRFLHVAKQLCRRVGA